MTDLLFHENSYLKNFEATVTEVVGDGVTLDATAFYIGGGGQPCGHRGPHRRWAGVSGDAGGTR